MGSPLHVPAGIGPGLLKHARSPMHAPLPMGPPSRSGRGPAPSHALTPMHEPSATAAVLLAQDRCSWQLFLAMFPSLVTHARSPRHALSPTVPSLNEHADIPWQARLA